MASTNSTTERLALGVDGGGTKTEAWLAHVEPAGEPIVLGRGKVGSSNPRAVGMETALINLGQAIDAAWADARLAPIAVDGAVLAMSGAGHVTVQEQIAAWANKRGLAKRLWFKHDAEPVLAEGTPEGWGVALIVGTGSAAIGCDRQGERKIVGGWGYHYGDEGSAYWIGRRALESIARAADGRNPATQLTQAILSRLQVDDPRAALGALEKTGNVRGAIASLADAVESAASNGDATAAGIVEAAAEELATMVATLAKQLLFGQEFPLALAGGVICGSELLRNRLQAALKARSLAPTPIKLVPHPVAGCLRIAHNCLLTEED
ncbi:MAG: N-acetylglucosamine kinase [Pirellulales bacterium]|nr:N-acetylglucosamine kinase [Pirellulales bacterium]